MDQDGLIINTQKEYQFLKEKILEKVKNKIILNKLICLFKVIDKYNFLENSIFFEDSYSEVDLVFFQKNTEDSGKVIINIRSKYSKYYVYGCKFYANNRETENIDQFCCFAEKILCGNYLIEKGIYLDKLYSFKVIIDKDEGIIKYGNPFTKINKKNISYSRMKGLNLLTN